MSYNPPHKLAQYISEQNKIVFDSNIHHTNSLNTKPNLIPMIPAFISLNSPENNYGGTLIPKNTTLMTEKYGKSEKYGNSDKYGNNSKTLIRPSTGDQVMNLNNYNKNGSNNYNNDNNSFIRNNLDPTFPMNSKERGRANSAGALSQSQSMRKKSLIEKNGTKFGILKNIPQRSNSTRL